MIRFCCFVVLFFVCEVLLRTIYIYVYALDTLIFTPIYDDEILLFYCFTFCVWSTFEEYTYVHVWELHQYMMKSTFDEYMYVYEIYTNIWWWDFVVLFFVICMWSTFDEYAYVYEILLFCCFVVLIFVFVIRMWITFDEYAYDILLFCFLLFVCEVLLMNMCTHMRFCCFVALLFWCFVVLFILCEVLLMNMCTHMRFCCFVLLFCCFVVFCY